MQVKELIKKLQNLEERGYGDWKVEVQYRDSGGDYSDRDEEIRLDLDNKNDIVIL